MRLNVLARVCQWTKMCGRSRYRSDRFARAQPTAEESQSTLQEAFDVIVRLVDVDRQRLRLHATPWSGRGFAKLLQLTGT
ncbi:MULTISPECIES: hypothetical protein [Streptomyces]|uniref:hypothetical protein n=1 Tax=Streptomyces TaxID=1883 RepID=UPI000F878E5C|nr:hypothetical protein [Streptomyces sp. WAC 01325]